MTQLTLFAPALCPCGQQPTVEASFCLVRIYTSCECKLWYIEADTLPAALLLWAEKMENA